MLFWSRYPLIKITSEQDGQNRFLKLTQQRFSIDPFSKDTHNDPTWAVPITITSGEDPTSIIFQTVMDSKSTTIHIPNINRDEWLKVLRYHIL
jgi:hypothetical protein